MIQDSKYQIVFASVKIRKKSQDVNLKNDDKLFMMFILMPHLQSLLSIRYEMIQTVRNQNKICRNPKTVKVDHQTLRIGPPKKHNLLNIKQNDIAILMHERNYIIFKLFHNSVFKKQSSFFFATSGVVEIHKLLLKVVLLIIAQYLLVLLIIIFIQINICHIQINIWYIQINNTIWKLSTSSRESHTLNLLWMKSKLNCLIRLISMQKRPLIKLMSKESRKFSLPISLSFCLYIVLPPVKESIFYPLKLISHIIVVLQFEAMCKKNHFLIKQSKNQLSKFTKLFTPFEPTHFPIFRKQNNVKEALDYILKVLKEVSNLYIDMRDIQIDPQIIKNQDKAFAKTNMSIRKVFDPYKNNQQGGTAKYFYDNDYFNELKQYKVTYFDPNKNYKFKSQEDIKCPQYHDHFFEGYYTYLYERTSLNTSITNSGKRYSFQNNIQTRTDSKIKSIS